FYPQRTTNYTYVGSHELAEVLLGLPFLSWRGRRFGPPDLMDRQYSVFVQEDWKPIDRLTVNVGLRYEYYTPFFSPTNEISMFDELPPPFTDPGALPAGYELNGVDKNLNRGEADHFNVAIQRELPGGFLAEAAYVGSRGRKMPFRVNINDPGGAQAAPFPTLGPVKV